jgi:hypothetical protein
MQFVLLLVQDARAFVEGSANYAQQVCKPLLFVFKMSSSPSSGRISPNEASGQLLLLLALLDERADPLNLALSIPSPFRIRFSKRM